MLRLRLLTLLLGLSLLLPAAVAAQTPQQMLPNGIARIGAANPGDTPLDFSDVGVAVIDTGIDLSNPDLNVVGGVDCSSGAGGYNAGNVRIEGGQRSIWEPAPRDAEGEPVPDFLTFDGLEFEIQTLERPHLIGGRNVRATGYDDGNGHGTHVAGIIGARDNGTGVVGVAPNASLYAVRVLGNSGGGSIENLICGLDWVEANADVIDVANMSLGARAPVKIMDVIEPCDTDEADYPPYIQRTELLKDELHEAVCDVVEAGVTLVVAAGNGWGDAGTVIPAAYPEVITVSSFADFDGLPGGLAVDADPDPDVNTVSQCADMGGTDDAFYSHLNGAPALGYGSFGGETVDIAAPGVCVFSTFPNFGFASLTGTSMATPHVTGTVARLIDVRAHAHASLEPDDVRTGLLAIAERQTDTFRDTDEWAEPLVRWPAWMDARS